MLCFKDRKDIDEISLVMLHVYQKLHSFKWSLSTPDPATLLPALNEPTWIMLGMLDDLKLYNYSPLVLIVV